MVNHHPNADPHEVRLNGDNSLLTLQLEPGGENTTNASYWWVRYSPKGDGHVLFLTSDLLDNQTYIYSDNIALARWLQREIERAAPFSDENIPILEADFESEGDMRDWWTERCFSQDTDISLTWYDFGTPYAWHPAPGTLSLGRPHGVYSMFIPADGARLLVNGVPAQGTPFPVDRSGTASSTSCLAIGEIWVRPR